MWQRPKTTRRYLHPPKCERIATQWAEGKLILGEVVLKNGTVPDYFTDTYSFGVWPVFGKDDLSADFKTAKMLCAEDGIPVHKIENRFGNLEVAEEAFCDVGRKCSIYAKFTLTNPSDKAQSFGIMVRTALEYDLVFDGPDVYKSYAPDIEVWKKLPSIWKAEGGILSDRENFIKVSGKDYTFDEEKGVARFKISPYEKAEIYLTLGKEVIPTADYEAQKRLTCDFYKSELKRIKNMPKNADEQMVKSLVVQLLQCFTIPKDTDRLLCRQGGLQRRVWPFEAMYALEALDRIGNFDDYTAPVIGGYFEVMQVDTGEIVPLGIYWAMSSAIALYSFADHALRRGEEFYLKHRDAAMRAFKFIKNTRVKETDNPAVFPGLFPPLQSSDAEARLQNWTFTDGNNLMGLKKIALAAEKFGDEAAEEIAAEVEDYRKVLLKCFETAKALSDDTDSLILTVDVPGMPKGPVYPFRVHTSVIASVLELSEKDVLPLLRGLEKANSRHEGLYHRMPDHYRMKDEDGKVRIWYTSLEEIFWFNVFRRLGKTAECEQIVKSIIDYSMTDEFYMVERYHPLDPWFAPWSPNASANGRLLIMLMSE